MIELEAIEKTYTSGDVVTPVLRDVSFRIEPGQYVAIMGASGTGKSTLMNILGCLDKPTAGHYRLDGIDMVNLEDDELSHLRNHKSQIWLQVRIYAKHSIIRLVKHYEYHSQYLNTLFVLLSLFSFSKLR